MANTIIPKGYYPELFFLFRGLLFQRVFITRGFNSDGALFRKLNNPSNVETRVQYGSDKGYFLGPK